jgi:hypothetical protein
MSDAVILIYRFMGLFWMSARIGIHLHVSYILRLIGLAAGERLSPYVAFACMIMAVKMIVA